MTARRRGFPAFTAQRRSTRGKSWWGRAWVQAMEDTSLDNGQLKKGRRYANSGQVGTITDQPRTDRGHGLLTRGHVRVRGPRRPTER